MMHILTSYLFFALLLGESFQGTVTLKAEDLTRRDTLSGRQSQPKPYIDRDQNDSLNGALGSALGQNFGPAGPVLIKFDDFTQRIQQRNLSMDDDRHSETLNPERRPQAWVALGDSFAAGPGAGDEISDGAGCVRGINSYPLRMQANSAMPGPAEGQKPTFTLKACTSDTTDNLLDPSNPNYQLGAVETKTDFVTLSIGGNDVKFGSILEKCVFGLGIGDCDGWLQEARVILYGESLFTKWFKIADDILGRMAWTKRGSNKRTAILQTSYSQFFDAYTDQCDSATFLPIGYGPTMTKDLRIKLNRLAHEVNYQMAYWVDLLNVHNSDNSVFRQPFTSAGYFVDLDQLYTGHRFCRDGVTEPDRNNADTWFYHLLAPKQKDPDGTQVDDTPGDIRSNPAALNDTTEQHLNETNPPNPQFEYIIKTFHPTSKGMEQSAKFMVGPVLRVREAAQLLGEDTVDIMVIGDYVPFASQDPESPIYQGIIPHLKAIFRDADWYSYPRPRPFPPRLKVNFFGSQGGPNFGNEPHETYGDVTIDQLHQKLKASPDLHLQRKLVILMAGTKDLLFDEDPVHAAQRLAKLIKTIFDADSEAVVLLGHIPMIGLNDDGKHWLPLQRRVVEYNARLSALSDQFLAEGFKVLKVHTTATTLEHLDGDFIRPNTKGYLRIAYDFAEAIAMANAFDFLSTSAHASRPGDMEPKAPSDTSKAVCSQDITTRDQATPSPDDIINSLKRDKATEDDFIDMVACKSSEMCKFGLDGIHGGFLGWELIYQNATTCVYAGGQKDSSDYNQLAVRTPDSSYNLDTSESCKAGVKAILDDCVKSGKWYGGAYKGADGIVVELKNLNYPRSSTVTLGGNPEDLSAIAKAALEGNPPKGGLPVVDTKDFPEHPVFI